MTYYSVYILFAGYPVCRIADMLDPDNLNDSIAAIMVGFY